jgi:hypothetical protein
MANYRFITGFRRTAWKSVGWLLLVSLATCGSAEQRAANQTSRAPGPTQELPAGTAANTTGGVATPTAAPATTSVPLVEALAASTPVTRIIHRAPPVATMFISHGRSYTISTRGNDMDENIYEHMLTSFAPAGTPPSPPPAELESVLFQPGDLPGTIAGEPTDNPIPPNFANDPPATTIVGRRLTRDGRAAGSVALLFYDNPSDLAQAYERLTANADPFAAHPNAMEPRTDVGDKAVTGRMTLASSTYGPSHIVVVIFARCHAMIDIRLNEQTDLTLDTAVAYAKRVDQRVAAVVCQ